VLTEDCVRAVFGLDSRVVDDPTTGAPMMLPLGRHHVVSEGSVEPRT
jgi:iron complex transport system ATP-binding protein